MDLIDAIEGRSGPYEVEQKALASLMELIPLRDAAKNRRERKLLSARIRQTREIAAWCRTRAGYRVPE